MRNKIKKTLLIFAIIAIAPLLSGCSKSIKEESKDQSNKVVDASQESQNEPEPITESSLFESPFDCGKAQACGASYCKETKVCLHDLAATCTPVKGTVLYNDPKWDINSNLEVEHEILGFQKGKCVYEGKVNAKGVVADFNGLSIHCELDNNTLQQVFTDGVFEKTISNNCSGTYVDILKKSQASSASDDVVSTEAKITSEKCLQQGGKVVQAKSDGTICGSSETNLGIIEDGVKSEGKLSQCCK